MKNGTNIFNVEITIHVFIELIPFSAIAAVTAAPIGTRGFSLN
jgi:hypothetical protein